MKWLLIAMMSLLGLAPLAHADEAEIVATEFVKRGATWQVNTTLRHADTGWEHYADAWRVVSANGAVLGTRTLYHPHVDEQPFARSLSPVAIPAGADMVYVEAHDKVHGWSKQRVKVDLRQQSGERFRVQRSD